MGMLLSKVFKHLFGQKEARLLILGLDAAGKTTILYKLVLGEAIATIPTIGFNVETIKCRNISFTVWDICRQQKMRPLLRHYYKNTQGIIFVVDSKDVERINDAKIELHNAMADGDLKGAILLVFANKQDLQGAITPAEVAEKLGLSGLKSVKWHIEGSCAKIGNGLYEGLDWLAKNM